MPEMRPHIQFNSPFFLFSSSVDQSKKKKQKKTELLSHNKTYCPENTTPSSHNHLRSWFIAPVTPSLCHLTKAGQSLAFSCLLQCLRKSFGHGCCCVEDHSFFWLARLNKRPKFRLGVFSCLVFVWTFL